MFSRISGPLNPKALRHCWYVLQFFWCFWLRVSCFGQCFEALGSLNGLAHSVFVPESICRNRFVVSKVECVVGLPLTGMLGDFLECYHALIILGGSGGLGK